MCEQTDKRESKVSSTRGFLTPQKDHRIPSSSASSEASEEFADLKTLHQEENRPWAVAWGADSSDSTPGLGTSAGRGCGPRKTKDKNKQTNKKNTKRKTENRRVSGFRFSPITKK